MCEELDKCYGTDGTYLAISYTNSDGLRRRIPENISWEAAYQRCNRPNHISYPNYGGKGIQLKFANFNEWWNELGRKPSASHSVDRINSEGHYEVGNVRWATPQEQATNRSSTRPVSLTSPDGSVEEFASGVLAVVGKPLSKDGIGRLCRNPSLTINGYCASFIT